MRIGIRTSSRNHIYRTTDSGRPAIQDVRIAALFLDESEIHLHPHPTRMWMKRGERGEVPAAAGSQKRCIYGALNYRTNQLTVRVGARKNAAEFLGFGAQLAREYSARSCLLVLDNVSDHTAKVVVPYLAEVDSTLQVLWLPPYSPDLNDIERVWKHLKAASLANDDFGTVENLCEAIEKVTAEFNAETNGDLSLRFRDPWSKNVLKVASQRVVRRVALAHGGRS